MGEPRVAMFMPGLGPDSLGWHVHVDFARRMRSAGLRFEVLTTGRSGRGRDDEHPVTVLNESRVWSWLAEPVAPLLRTRGLLTSVAVLTRYLRRHRDDVDLLHVEVAYPHGAAVALARRLARWPGPLVVTPMGEDTLVVETAGYGFRRYRVPRRLVAWALREADLIRCISPLHERYIAEIAPDRPRVTIPLNVSAAAAAAASETADERAQRRTTARRWLDTECGTEGRPVVVALGRLHPFKGIDVLIRAMRSVPEATLVIVGPSLDIRPHGDVAPGLLALADTLGIRDRVRWVGSTPPDRSLDWLAGADVVAVPSHLESLNKVCVEAAAVGTPFVVTETTGIAGWVTRDQDGGGVARVVPPADPAALGTALADITTGRWRADPDALAAFARPFAPEHIARALADAYRDLLASRRGES